jgi:hypothetical protein
MHRKSRARIPQKRVPVLRPEYAPFQKGAFSYGKPVPTLSENAPAYFPSDRRCFTWKNAC